MKPYYADDLVTLYHADALEFLASVAKPSALVLTDLPYCEVNRESNGLRSLDKGSADVLAHPLEDILSAMLAVAEGSVYAFCGTEQVSTIRAMLVEAGLSTRLGVWWKDNPSPMNGEHIWLSAVEAFVYGKRAGATFNEFCASPVLRYPVDAESPHPTPKPVKMFRRLILASSNPGDTVIDPFVGGGTTARAAKDLGRKCVGCDLDEQHLEYAVRRLAQEVLF